MKTVKDEQLVKRKVLLLLGAYYADHHAGIARYAREAGWIIEALYAIGGLKPIWWKGDGIISLITAPVHYETLKMLPKCPMVDLSKGWISSELPAHIRQERQRKKHVSFLRMPSLIPLRCYLFTQP